MMSAVLQRVGVAGKRCDLSSRYDDVEPARPPGFTVKSLDVLSEEVGIDPDELKLMYRAFKTQCPSGYATKRDFEVILGFLYPAADPTDYADHLFRLFLHHSAIEKEISFDSFLQSLSTMIHGVGEIKVTLLFHFYDVDSDGRVSPKDLLTVMHAVHELWGADLGECDMVQKTAAVFREMDRTGRGYVTKSDFREFLKNNTLA